MEDEADCIGYDLSEQAGFSADSASARVFDTIQADQDRRKALSDILGDQLKAQLSQAVTPAKAVSFLTGGVGGLREGLIGGAARLALGVAAERASQAPPQHRPPPERKKGLADYSSDAYPEGAPLRDEQHSWLASVRGTSEFAQAKIAVAGVNDAKKARADGDYPKATAALAQASQTSFRNAPLVLNESARLHGDMGDAAGADQLFMQAHASPDQTVDGYVDHVQMLYKTKQNDRAMQIAAQGAQRFGGDQKPFISLMIAISRQAGREDEAERYLGQCLSLWRRRPDQGLPAGRRQEWAIAALAEGSAFRAAAFPLIKSGPTALRTSPRPWTWRRGRSRRSAPRPPRRALRSSSPPPG